MNGEKKSGVAKGLIIALVIMLVLLIGWHLLLPVLGIAVAMTAIAWAIVIATVVLIAIGVLLFYVLSGIGIVIVCFLGVAWFIGALIFFPFLFPFLVPLLILLLFVGIIRKKRDR